MSFNKCPVKTPTTVSAALITPSATSFRIPATVVADAGSQPIPQRPITALASADGSRRITTSAQNLKLSGAIVTLKSTATVSTQAKASTLVAIIQTSLTNVNSAMAKLSSGAAKFSIQATFSQKLSDTLTQGIGNLVDANMAAESAMLQSLQVKQQLGVQALSIANQAPQTILGLFR